MGLSVRVYSNIELCSEDDDNCCFVAYVLDDKWLHKIKNLEQDKCYTGKCICNKIDYAYSTHNRFREALLKLIGRIDLLDANEKVIFKELNSTIPFYEFIDFADNEGCLDWEISEKILLDFESFMPDAIKKLTPYWLSYYKDWRITFNAAAKKKGVVVFA